MLFDHPVEQVPKKGGCFVQLTQTSTGSFSFCCYHCLPCIIYWLIFQSQPLSRDTGSLPYDLQLLLLPSLGISCVLYHLPVLLCSLISDCVWTGLYSIPVAVPDFYFYWSLKPVASVVIRISCIIQYLYCIICCFILQSQTVSEELHGLQRIPEALPDLFLLVPMNSSFYCYQRQGYCLSCIIYVSFANHRPYLERYRVSIFLTFEVVSNTLCPGLQLIRCSLHLEL